MDMNKTYTVVLEPMAEGGFLVHVSALPEVVTSGDTEAEALELARDAIELVLASRRERGEAIPDIVIERRGGEAFVLSLKRPTKSPLDIPSVDRELVTTKDIVDAVRQSRAQPWRKR